MKKYTDLARAMGEKLPVPARITEKEYEEFLRLRAEKQLKITIKELSSLVSSKKRYQIH